jgi:uncharacterized integral membrane protein
MAIETTIFLAIRIIVIVYFISATMATAALIYHRRRGKRDTSRVKSAGMREVLVPVYAASTAFVIITPFVILGFLWLFFVIDCLKVELALLIGAFVQFPLIFHILKDNYLNLPKGCDTSE